MTSELNGGYGGVLRPRMSNARVGHQLKPARKKTERASKCDDAFAHEFFYWYCTPRGAISSRGETIFVVLLVLT